MTLTPEQKKTVADWVAAGDNLYSVQKKLSDQFKIQMTYMDVRFLVDDLDLQLKDPAPRADAGAVGAGAPAPEKKGFLEKAKEKLGLSAGAAGAAPAEEEDLGEPVPDTGVRVTVDKVNLNPNAMASGTVTFRDGVTGKWMVDHQGRPALMELSKPGYRPSPAEAQAFMQELSLALQGL